MTPCNVSNSFCVMKGNGTSMACLTPVLISVSNTLYSFMMLQLTYLASNSFGFDKSHLKVIRLGFWIQSMIEGHTRLVIISLYNILKVGFLNIKFLRATNIS
ncbi:hypothetical protein MrNuV_ORF038 [Macrobrachium rosenbergii nudivirus]|nr:hypothetical protein MrNuV_ORF038 [Macrobrachium rosenbergii nudivirus]